METEHCRICFSSRGDLSEICDEIRQIFHSLTSIHLINSEIYSSFICQECKGKLQSTGEYVKLLAENEMQLRNKFSVENSMLLEDHQISPYFPQIKTEHVEQNAIRNQATNIPNRELRSQKRSYQQMSEGGGSRSNIESVYLNEYRIEDTFDDVSSSPVNGESSRTAEHLNSLSIEMIEDINDLEDAKNVFKLMLHEIRGQRSQEAKPTKIAASKPSHQISSVDSPALKNQKIANMFEFEAFIKRINRDHAYRKDLIHHWKNLANNSRQTLVNGKAYSILNELFERDFLVSSVRWGKPFEKDKIRSDQVYLKQQYEFTDIILDVYELERSKDSIDHIAKIFKNVFNNKVRREERKLQ